MKTALKWALDILLRLVLLVFIWGMLSVTGTLFPPLKWEGAVTLWNYVSGGQLKQDLFVRQAVKYTFPPNSYRSLVNPGTNANLAASGDHTSAYAAGDTLYYRFGDGLYRVQRDKPKERKRLLRWQAPGALVGSGRALLSVDPSRVSLLRISRALHCQVAQEGWLNEYQTLTFPALADRLYDLLCRQETQKITSAELAVLAYYTMEGTLLDYEDGTAWLADSTTEPGTVILWRQDGPGSREEVLRYRDAFAGQGAGRFIARGVFVYVTGDGLAAYRLEDGAVITFRPDKVGFPAQAVNYALDREGKLWLLFLSDEDRLVRIDYSSVDTDTIRWERTRLNVEDQGEPASLYTVEDLWWVLRGEGAETMLFYDTLDQEVQG